MQEKKEFVCVPCNLSCDLETFSKGGSCATCGMKLLQKGSYNKKLSKEEIVEDLNILTSTLKNNHPGIYDYQSEKDYEKTNSNLIESIESDSNVLEAYKIFSQNISVVGDAHTYVMHPYYDNILQEELLFPVIPEINNNEIWINGKRIKSMNGNSEDEILKQLQKYSNSDANKLSYKNAFIEMEFPLRFFTFMDKSSVFNIIFIDGETKNIRGKSFFNKGLRPKKSSPSLLFNNDTAVIKIPSWEDESASSFNNDLAKMSKNSKLGKFLSDAMKNVIHRNVNNLVIDLTGNKGGKSGPAAILLSYLINKPFKYYSEIKIASDKFPTKQYISNKELVNFYESDDSKKLINKVNEEYFFKENLLPEIQPNAEYYSGNIELLVDKYTLSVSTDVVSILQNNREIKITGKEIGGSLYHYCAGNYINLILPNSKMEVNIPLQRLKY
ncbi:hypothetical protein GCM10009430_45190 [Aquimarina litoralis]|uniref:Tail specific protease domain-containing protein n=2 Tax=Aquimarina litoralis TaxID=584605 RepID=A0ABN1J8N0_9FLAO